MNSELPLDTPARKDANRWIWIVLLAAALLGGLGLRLIGLGEPPFDSHAYRQTQTLSTIEDFYSNGIDLLHPRTVYMGYPGTFVLELPIFQALCAILYKVAGPYIGTVRILNCLFGALTAFILYRWARGVTGHRAAILATLVFWLAPLNVLYQSSMLFDPLAVLCSLVAFVSLNHMFRAAKIGRAGWSVAVFFLATSLTALLKALYLWPVIILWLVMAYASDRATRMVLVRAALGFGIAGVLFLLWNRHLHSVNDASFFSRGVSPSMLLGFGALTSPKFYHLQLLRNPQWWLGLVGLPLYAIGLYLLAVSKRVATERCLLAVVIIPPTYLLAFPNINLPHDYYQLVILPYLAVVAGIGGEAFIRFVTQLRWFEGIPPRLRVAAVAAVMLVAAFSLHFWRYHLPLNPTVSHFLNVVKPRTERGAYGMMLMGPDRYPLKPGAEIPEFLYSAGIWGYGRVVQDDRQAQSEFEKVEPEFPEMSYLVLYGLHAVPAYAAAGFEKVAELPDDEIVILRRQPKRVPAVPSGLL